MSGPHSVCRAQRSGSWVRREVGRGRGVGWDDALAGGAHAALIGAVAGVGTGPADLSDGQHAIPLLAVAVLLAVHGGEVVGELVEVGGVAGAAVNLGVELADLVAAVLDGAVDVATDVPLV